MFKIIKIPNRERLDKWLLLNPAYLTLQEDKSGYTFTIEVEVGLQIIIWGCDEDMLLKGINYVAENQDKSRPKIEVKPRPPARTRIIERAVEVHVPVKEFVLPIGWMGKDMGYTITGEGVVTTYQRVEL